MGCFSCPLASFWVASTQIADERPFEGEPWIASRARILLLPGAAGAGLRLPAKGRSSTICVEVTQKQSKARPRKVLLPGSAGASARRGQPSSARGGRGRAGAHPRRRRAVDPHRRLLQHLRARARVSGGSRLAPRGVGVDEFKLSRISVASRVPYPQHAARARASVRVGWPRAGWRWGGAKCPMPAQQARRGDRRRRRRNGRRGGCWGEAGGGEASD